ncbi:PDZ domain-containing protein GIPC3-like [Sycon ciliatum]|uniref:PDZ domain-containing protein GIPC3-like n=1 Tax=Sycon ciliatum TaxID=27933 RepID=UPI0020AAE051|eukprot:scpid49446/ scgid9204/ PDZ domain-containing protein GIPC1; GAIP C-terminus-interacting protein; GLUT1 C-terminal-binding protein; RGS-GAIP-interacting protein; RGS19-interacting protein 1
MPIFKRSDEKKKASLKRPVRQASVPAPPPPKPASLSPLNVASSSDAGGPLHPHRDLSFHVQLAHGSATKRVKDFRNVRELYHRISAEFNISAAEILFCTLNTHKVDMSKLLGGQIGLDDFIFVHVHGHSKEVTINKSEPSLGLTVTDNGAGCAFVKKIKESSIICKTPEVSIGDHIVSINGRNLYGTRHYEVAKLLKELPQHCDFTMKLIEPHRAFDAIAPRAAASKAASSTEETVGTGRTTLRLRADGPPVLETLPDETTWTSEASALVDELLESFMGIRDIELADAMVQLAKDVTDYAIFASAMEQELGEFEFPDEFIADVWAAVLQARKSR